jgi:cytochrome c-type biogenesis protein CcmH/NrfF
VENRNTHPSDEVLLFGGPVRLFVIVFVVVAVAVDRTRHAAQARVAPEQSAPTREGGEHEVVGRAAAAADRGSLHA